MLTYSSQALLTQLYRSPELAEAVKRLEKSACRSESILELGNIVNTSASQLEPISRWVRYREGYSPTLVKFLLNKFPMRGDGFVLDPMCGSGSTQVAAQELGLASIGTDVNPYAVLVSSVKTRPLTPRVHEKLSSIPLDRIRATGQRRRIGNSDEHLQRYFPHGNLRTLLAIRDWLGTHLSDEPVAHDFALVALLAIVESSSNRKKDGNGLATRPSKVKDPVTEFEVQLDLMLRDVAVSIEGHPALSAAYLVSALEVDRAVDLATKALKRDLGAVVFSPPYANSFDYFESYKLELLFGEFYTPQQLQRARANLIRNYRQSGHSSPRNDILGLEPLIEEIVERIPDKEKRTGTKDSRSRLVPNMLRGYFGDMKVFLERAAKAMKPGVQMHIVVDQSAYLGVPVPTDLILAGIGVEATFEFSSLLVCRAAKTSAQQLQAQPMLRQVLRESVVTLTKLG